MGLWIGVSVLTLVDFTENVSLFVMMMYRRVRVKFVKKTRRLSTASAIVRSSGYAPYAIDTKGSCIIASPKASASRSNFSGKPVTVSGLGTKLPHVHFEES